MSIAMTVPELKQAQAMIDAGDLSGFYSFMASQGYNYAILAGGLVSGSSFSGAAATNYLLDSAKAQGVDFGVAQLSSLESKMATAWVAALSSQASSSSNQTVSADLTYQQTLLFHEEVFKGFGLTVDAWTLAVPGEVLGSASMESNWNSMLAELGSAPVGALASETALTAEMALAASGVGYTSQQASAAVGWISTNASNLGSDFASLFESATPSSQVTSQLVDGVLQSTYTDGADVSLTKYQSAFNNPTAPPFSLTENVWSLPVALPTISVKILADGVIVNESAGANATMPSAAVLDASGDKITVGGDNSGTPGIIEFVGDGNTITENAGATVNLNSTDNNTLTNAVTGQTFTISNGSIIASGDSGPFGSGVASSFTLSTDGSMNVALSDANGVLTDNDKFSSTGDFTQDQQFSDGVLSDAINYTAGAVASEDFYDSVSGTETSEILDLATGNSQETFYTGLPTGESLETDTFSGTNATGTKTASLFNLTDGTSQQYAFTGLPSGESSVDSFFSGANGTGTKSEDLYDFTDGSSQTQSFTGLASGTAEVIESYTATNGTGTETSQITDFTAGNSQQSIYTGLPTGESLETDAYTGTNATGTRTASLFNLTDGTSQEFAFTGLPSGESSVDSFFSSANGSGIKSEDLYDFTNGSSQTQSFTGLASGTSEVIESYTATNGTGTETSLITDFTAGNSQESLYTGLPSGESSETDAFTGTNATGTRTAALFDLTNGTSQEYSFTGLPSGASSEDAFFSGTNGTGTQTEVLYDLTDGSSQVQSFAGLSSGVSQLIQNFTGADGAGTETSQVAEMTDGTSQEVSYAGLASGNSEVLQNYSAADGAGVLTLQYVDHTDGTSEVDQYNAGALTTADAFNIDKQLVLQNLYSGDSVAQQNVFTPGNPYATTQTYFTAANTENYQVSFDSGGHETQDDIFDGATTETERLLFNSGNPYAADALFFSAGNLTQDVSLNYAGQETQSILYGPGQIETEADLFNAGSPYAYQQTLFTGGTYASQVDTFNSTTGAETASATFNTLTGSETGYSSIGGSDADRSAADSSGWGKTVVVDYGNGGGYGYYGFAGNQSTINATLGSSIGSIAQADLNLGDTAGAAVAEAGLHDAQQAAQGNTSGASGNTLEAAKWGGEQITWSLASTPATGGTPFSNYLASQYDAEVQQAFATWGATSDITFKEVADTSQSDIRVGWSNLNTASTGTVGYTTFNAQNGNMDPGATIRLEDPSQDSLVANASGQLSYAGTDATLEQALLHEVGHTLGLADNSDPTSVMFYELNSANRTLDSTDIAGIQSLYGKNAPVPASSGSIDQLIQAMASYTPSSPGFMNPANIAPMKAQSLLLAAAH